MKNLNRFTAGTILAIATLAAVPAPAATDAFTFNMVRSQGLAAFPMCAPNVQATVTITPGAPGGGAFDTMDVACSGLPPNTDFDFFVIQVPNPPFGLCWYQGDLVSGPKGNAAGHFIGRFSIETFIVAPGVAPAPIVLGSVGQNPQTGPVQLYHLGAWFDKPSDAVKAGGPGGVTPFNGQHHAGAQILSTRNFPKLGPLSALRP